MQVPCGTPTMIAPEDEKQSSTFVTNVRLEKKDSTSLTNSVGRFRLDSLNRRPSCQTLSKAFSTS